MNFKLLYNKNIVWIQLCATNIITLPVLHIPSVIIHSSPFSSCILLITGVNTNTLITNDQRLRIDIQPDDVELNCNFLL